jgi:hypothetical protein
MRERKSRHVIALCKKFAHGVMFTSTITALRPVLIVVMINIWYSITRVNTHVAVASEN